MGLWERRGTWAGRIGLAAGLAATTIWSAMLLGRTSNWFPALRPLVIVFGTLGVLGILALPLLRSVPKLAVGLVAALGLGAALAAPLFSTVATAATPHNGAIPSVTPAPAGGQGGPGGGGFPGGGRGFSPGTLPGGAGATSPGGGFPGGGFPGGGAFPGGTNSGTGTGGNPFPQGFAGGAPSFGGSGQGRFGGAGGGGGFLNSSQSNPALTRALQANASRYTWAAATVNANNAAGYQLASGEPVMAIGGFNGTDPAPTLAQFEKYVAEGKIHYFISSGGGGFAGGPGGSTSDDASQITSWVESHFTSESLGGVTVYDLSSATS
jgi:hypothetical protein